MLGSIKVYYTDARLTEANINEFLWSPSTNCSKFCEGGLCNKIIGKDCPEMMYLPA
jgi:hypothetical protein